MTWKRINETVCTPRWRCTAPGCGRVVTAPAPPTWTCDRCGGNAPVALDTAAAARARRVLAATWEDVEKCQR